MLLIAVEVEYTLNEVLEKHGRVPLQQQVSQAKLPKAAKERGKRRPTYYSLSVYRYAKNSARQQSTEFQIHPSKRPHWLKQVKNATCFVCPCSIFHFKAKGHVNAFSTRFYLLLRFITFNYVWDCV